jgi:signal transduction histidine kinase
VRQLGGWLQIKSSASGTKVIVTLPVKESAGDDSGARASGFS